MKKQIFSLVMMFSTLTPALSANQNGSVGVLVGSYYELKQKDLDFLLRAVEKQIGAEAEFAGLVRILQDLNKHALNGELVVFEARKPAARASSQGGQ